jgi:hypothetical protein
MVNCGLCRKYFETDTRLTLHYQNKSICREFWKRQIRNRAQAIPLYDPRDPEQIPRNDEPVGGFEPQDIFEEHSSQIDDAPQAPEAQEAAQAEDHAHFHEPQDIDTHPEDTELQPPEDVPTQPTVDAQGFRRILWKHWNSPKTYGRGVTAFEARQAEEENAGESPFGPFRNAETFEVAEWLLDAGISQRAASKLFHTRMVSIVCVDARLGVLTTSDRSNALRWNGQTLARLFKTLLNCHEVLVGSTRC